MGQSLCEIAKDREDRGKIEYSDSDWVDLLKLEDLVNGMEAMSKADGDYSDAWNYLTSRGLPNLAVVDIACYKTVLVGAHMLKDGNLKEDPAEYFDDEGSLNNDGLWKIMQLATIACFQYGFAYGIKHGVEASDTTTSAE
jgi:hypothetical protein